jgi:isoleucyl-tRNA synthetase
MAHTASVDYLKDPSLHKELFPFDFITEAVDQSRGWFYSLLYTSVVMHDSAPFKACVSQEHVLDEDGGKMSKSRGNVVWAKDAFADIGADPFRVFVLTRSASWSRMNYDSKEIELTRKKLDVLWNVVLFAETYMDLDKFKYDEKRMKKALDKADLEDKWLLSRVQSVVSEFRVNMDKFMWHHAGRVLLDFISEDLSRVYLPLVKKRVWLDSDDPKKVMAYDVLYHTLQTFLRCFNVFTPFLAEKLHTDFLTRFAEGLPESINMEEMPGPDSNLLDEEMEATFEILQELRTASSHARNKKGVKLRHPVAKVTLIADSKETAKRSESLTELLKDDLNTRGFEVLLTDVMAEFTTLTVKPNYKTLGPKYKDMMKQLVSTLQSVDAVNLRSDLEKGKASVTVEGKKLKLEPDDVEFEESLPDHLSYADSKIGKVYVDVTRTKELEAEGLVRDVIRRVQVMRKELDLKVEQSVDVLLLFSDEDSVELSKMFEAHLANEIRAESLEMKGPSARPKWKDYSYVKEWEIDDLKLKVGMNPK